MCLRGTKLCKLKMISDVHPVRIIVKQSFHLPWVERTVPATPISRQSNQNDISRYLSDTVIGG